MKAAVYRRYGSPGVVSVDDMPKPVPRDDEVLVRIHAATLGVVDSLARRGAPLYARSHFGLRRPRFPVLGSDFAGQIEATGPAVTRLAVGDQVFGTTAPRFGAHAEYACLSEQAALAPKPANVTYAEAAALADTTALCFLRDKEIYRFGEYASRWCIVAGAAAGFFLALARVDYIWIANAIYLGFVLWAVAGSAIKLVAYRRGLSTL